MKALLGYHFVGDTLRDGRPIPADGEWLTHDGPIVPCESGLHMSVDPFDALQYAPGATLCRVELRGDLIEHGGDKWVGRRRRIVARIDATTLLRRFACDCALSVAHLWDMPGVVWEYLKTMDESLRNAAWYAAWNAALNAARDAARDAARNAARYAAWNAAWNAARDAAWNAARDAARNAARNAAWDAARNAARNAQRQDFNSRVEAAFAADGKVGVR
jgi:hypothetical protein